MSKQLTIQQIAQLAGVSVGTVDRILHNRGNVSKKAAEKVNKVLDSEGYSFNIHTSAVGLRKNFQVVIAFPNNKESEYWDLVFQGVKEAEEEYNDLNIKCQFLFFDQYDAKACSRAFKSIPEMQPSGVILATTYIEETKSLCKQLDEKQIPYIFVDGDVDDTNPIASFFADQEICGKLQAKLIRAFSPASFEIALSHPLREGGRVSNNSQHRINAFKQYFKNSMDDARLKYFFFSPAVPQKVTQEELRNFLEANPRVKSIAVGLSTANMIADALFAIGRTDIHVCGFDLTPSAKRCLQQGTLDFVIDQKPVKQGYDAFDSLVHYLVYGSTGRPQKNIFHADVIFPENI